MIEALAAAIVAVLAAWFFGRRSGAKTERDNAEKRDRARARTIEDAADRARRADDGGADPLDRLRDRGRLRD